MGLGLWNRSLEPKANAFWYLCSRPGVSASGNAAVLGPVETVEALAIRRPERGDLESLVSRCEGYPGRIGPYPLEATARARLAQQVSAEKGGARVAVLLKKRIIDGPAEESSAEEN